MSADRAAVGELSVGHEPQPGTALYFPVEAEVPESKRHLEARTLLYQFLKLAFADRAAIGCDQFVYWDPTNPRVCLAPDAFVYWGEADNFFRSFKVWEHGTPQVAVEVISDADERDRDWAAKVDSYRSLGVSELVRFDPEANEEQLRIWDHVAGDLVERDLGGRNVAQSNQLPGFWLLREHPDVGLALRLSHDELGTSLYPTLAEREAEACRAETEAHRAAEERIRELEAELRRRS